MIISEEIICPICKENCSISFKDYKINLYNCKNGHNLNNILFQDFNNTQKIEQTKIICEFCKIVNKNDSIYNDQFYKCIECNKNICLECFSYHNIEHNIIEYNLKNYICLEHNAYFNSFCRNCKQNLCIKCEYGHKDKQNIINFKNIFSKTDLFKNQLNELTKLINKYKEMINGLKTLLDNIFVNLHLYENISKNY